MSPVVCRNIYLCRTEKSHVKRKDSFSVSLSLSLYFLLVSWKHKEKTVLLVGLGCEHASLKH